MSTACSYECYHYAIIRHYFKGGHRTILTCLTLAQAQEHCGREDTRVTGAIRTLKSALGR